MRKRAKSDHPIHDLLAERWSPRAFADKAVPKEVLARLFEAARWAPSSNNGQPWQFMVATKDNPQEFERALNCLVEFNQNWAKSAPVLVLTLTQSKFQYNNKPNAHAWHDVGLAMANLSVQATAEGLHVHQMAGIEADKIRETYDLPEDIQPVTAAAIGYIGDVSTLPEGLAKREREERERKRQAEFVFSGEYKKAAEWAK